MSKYCKKGVKLQAAENEMAAMISSISLSFVGQGIGVFDSTTDLCTAAIGHGKRGKRIPIGHHVFRNNVWVRELSAPQPTCWLKAQPCTDDHRAFGHEVTDKSALHPVGTSVVTDTGCQSTAVPTNFAYRLGFKKKDFIPVKMTMKGVEGSSLGIVGAIVLEFSCQDNHGRPVSTRQLCYVSEKITRVYLSRQGCNELGMVDDNFPSPKAKNIGEVATAHMDDCTCSCPKRESAPPPLPTALPAGITVEDAEAPAKLKQWLLDHYASSVFNVCEHQELPLMSGNPLELHVDPNAKPVACHKPTPGPLHWKERVKADLDRDVALGVLERVPDNTPTPWPVSYTHLTLPTIPQV